MSIGAIIGASICMDDFGKSMKNTNNNSNNNINFYLKQLKKWENECNELNEIYNEKINNKNTKLVASIKMDEQKIKNTLYWRVGVFEDFKNHINYYICFHGYEYDKSGFIKFITEDFVNINKKRLNIN